MSPGDSGSSRSSGAVLSEGIAERDGQADSLPGGMQAAEGRSICDYFHSIFHPEIQQYEDQLDALAERLQQFYGPRYGRFITPGKLDIPLSETVEYEDKNVINRMVGETGGVLWFNNGIKSYVGVGTGHELQTTVHENLHQLSSNGGSSGIVVNGQDIQLNEAITEMLTQRTLGADYGPDYSLYSDNRDAMALLESEMGEDTISEAYFQNKPELIKDRFEGVMGPGSWAQLSEAFEDSISDQAHTRESGIARRDNLIFRYITMSNKKKGGTEEWIEMLL